VEITEADLPDVIRKTVSMKDIDHNPYVITEEMVTEAFEKLAAFGKTYGETRVFR
jgi:hypothetical protein